MTQELKRVFVSGMAYGAGKSGTSVYIHSVVEELCHLYKVDLLLLNDDDFPVNHNNLTIIRVPQKLASPVINMLWHLFILPYRYNYKKYDFVFLPAANRRLFCRKLDNLVVTFHDLSQFHIPNKYDAFRTFYIKKVIPFFLRKVTKIVAISQATKNDLMHFYGLNEKNILVSHNGFNHDNKEVSNSSTSVKATLEHITQKPFFLYVARIEHPGKNHLNLLKAYQALPKNITDNFDLVLAGQTWSGSDNVFSYHSTMELKQNIHFPGFVSAHEMESLYSSASLYIFPSLYEGFGIPLLEAMSYGVPVLCSDTPALTEVGGDAVEVFSPHDINDIAQRIQKVISNQSRQRELTSKGYERIADFSWKKHTEQLITFVKS